MGREPADRDQRPPGQHPLVRHADEDEWYWDLRRQRAVPSGERGPADDVLGPYPSREAAEHWRERVDRRNEAWDEDDERWDGVDREDRPARDI